MCRTISYWVSGAVAAALLLSLSASPTSAAECADPTGDSQVLATDALVVLRAAVALEPCDLCVCDVDGSGAVMAVDALTVLVSATGGDVTLNCPPCSTTTTTTTTSTSTTTVPSSVMCGDPGAIAPACDGYCGVNGQGCRESPAGSGQCQCIFGLSCGSAGGPPNCNGSCPALKTCRDQGGLCRCVL